MSTRSMSDVVAPMQPRRSELATLSNKYISLRTFRNWERAVLRQVRNADTHHPNLGTGGLNKLSSRHPNLAIINSSPFSNKALVLAASAHTGNPEVTRVLIVCLVVTLATIISIGAAILWRSDGQTLRSAILKGGAAFAGTVTVLILLMGAAGFL